MEIKVKEVSSVDEKSIQEVEESLLEKQEAERLAREASDEVDEVDEVDESNEFGDDQVLSYLKEKYGKDVDSIDSLFKEPEQGAELPEDVAAYMKFKKETGRGWNDFAKLNRSIEGLDDDSLLREYLLDTEEGLDNEDVDTLMTDYDYDEDVDDESDIKKIKIKKKKIVSKARKHFEEQKEKYKAPLESGGTGVSEEVSQKLKAYDEYIDGAKSFEEKAKRRKEVFLEQTDKVFGNEFKGFEFKVDDDKTVTFSAGDAAELKKSQSDAQNFLGKFLDENGLMKDAGGYHKALSVAMNPEKFARFFYEQGQSSQADNSMRKLKNVSMSEQRAPEVRKVGGQTIKSVSTGSSKGLVIKSRKKN
jgi:hypothetical protein